jgi:5-methylcytosine-specific restriction protein A
MRAEFATLADSYPRSPQWRDPAFAGSSVATLVGAKLPAAINSALPEIKSRFLIEGSAGQGSWTYTPWVAILDPAVTTSVEEGFYVVYLLSLGAERLYLSLNQGCTILKNEIGIRGARDELGRRAEIMRSRIRGKAKRLAPVAMDLNVQPSVWRGKLYEAGLIAGVQYDASALPSEETMITDLREALGLYGALNQSGGWEAVDDIWRDAEADAAASTLEQAKRYRQHRAIERQSSHSKKVKKKLGARCMGCLLEMRELYGPIADGFIEAHHLIPLSSLNDNEVVRFDPEKDFAVLCPNCHRIIHRMDDPTDIEALRLLVRNGLLDTLGHGKSK